MPTERREVWVWPHLVETTPHLYLHSIWGAESYATSKHIDLRSQLLSHHPHQKVQIPHTKVGHCTPYIYTRTMEGSLMNLTRVTVGPVSKILFIYSTCQMKMHLIAIQEKSCTGVHVEENPHKTLCCWPNHSQVILVLTLLCKDAFEGLHAKFFLHFDQKTIGQQRAYEWNNLGIAEQMLFVLRSQTRF